VILVDSSVWIDYFRGVETPAGARLETLLASTQLYVGDLILAEVLQGCTTGRAFGQVRRELSRFEIVRIVDEAVAVASAHNYRKLRSVGLTVRKTIDCLIATRCIVDGYALLYSDRDFDPFVGRLGLEAA